MLSEDELKKKTKEIQDIYDNAMERLKAIEKERNQVIENFINKIRDRRLAELKKSFANARQKPGTNQQRYHEQ